MHAAIRCLQRGGIVCIPTESSYGLAVRADDPLALTRLQNCKGRAASAPFGMIAADESMVRGSTGQWPVAAEELAARHWPGPLTLILPPLPSADPRLIGPSGGIGIRVPSHEGIRQACASCSSLLTATSANPHGLPPATNVDQARSYFGDKVDYYWDEGDCVAEPSTLVDFDEQGRGIVLRQGPVAIDS